MGYQENQTVGYLISGFVGVGIFTYYLIQHTQQAGYDPTTISSRMGTLVLIIIGVQIVLNIAFAMAVSIIQAIITRDEDPVLSDERDNLIQLKTEQVAFTVFSIGFILAMLALATGFSQMIVFSTIVYSLLSATIIGFIAKLYLYRKGM
jgi:uncharacterized membrane protein